MQWPCVSLLTRGTLQIWIQYVRQRSDPTLEQTNRNRYTSTYLSYFDDNLKQRNHPLGYIVDKKQMAKLTNKNLSLHAKTNFVAAQ